MTLMLPKLDTLDKKSKDEFPNKIVRKVYSTTIPEFKRFPTYVSEFLIGDYADENGIINQDAINRIVDLMKLKAFEKKSKEAIKYMAVELGFVEIIDHFEAYTDLKKGTYFTHVSIIDEYATVNRDLLSPSKYQSLLKGGLWGKAKFQHVKRGDLASLNMNEFECYQTTNVILKNYINARKQYNTEDWIDFLIRSIGFNNQSFTRNQKFLYLTRLIPIVEPCTNLLELGPPGTGKSFIYENASEYCRVLLGGEITPAKLIYDQNRRRIGIIFKKDVVCFDEINKTNLNLIKLLPKIQQIMASNRVERGELEAMTEASLVFQGNIDFILKNNRAQPKEEDYLKILPKGMNDSAFLDRIHIFLHGWDFPRLLNEHINRNLGLISNYFGQILHKLRRESVTHLIDEKIELYKIDRNGDKKGISIRDKSAIYNTISGFIKLVFPHKVITDDEWKELTEFAIKLRQNVIDEIQKIDKTLSRTLGFDFIDKISLQKPVKKEETISPEIVKSIETELELNKPSNIDAFQLDFMKIYINSQNYFVRKVPYWVIKILVDNDSIAVENQYYKLKTQNHLEFQVETIENNSIKISKIGMPDSKNYENEEDGLNDIGKKLNELLVHIEIFGKYKRRLGEYKFRCMDLEPNQEITQVIKDLEQKESKLVNITSSLKRNIEEDLNTTKSYIQRSLGLEPDLLSYNYKPLIWSSDQIIKIIQERIEQWKNETGKFSSFKDIYKKLYPLIKKKTVEKAKTKQKFQGKKFPLFAFDVNNLLISFKHKYPNYFFNKESPIVRIKKKYLKDEPYLAYFFASAHLARYLSVIPQNEFNHILIEKLIKDKHTGIHVDVDALLAGIITPIIEKYKDQISHFYLGSGDKDFHFIIEMAKKYNIPVSIIVIEESTLSIDLAQLVPPTNLVTLY